MYRLILLVLILLVVLSSCLPAPAAGPGVLPSQLPHLTDTPVLPPPSITYLPSATPSQPAATPTFAPTRTPTLNPMSILGLRARAYPGSDIIIEKELASAANYHRYYASYRSDGLKIYALLTIPDGEMPAGGWPAIVFNHGYIPPKEYRTTERYIAYVDWLARSGYVVFRIDYRGNDQSEGKPGGAYGDPGYTIDVMNAVASIQRYPVVNPLKIGMWGHSMGGFLTLRTMVISKDIKAGVIWSGVVGTYYDLFYNWHPNQPTPTPVPDGHGWRSEWVKSHGTPKQDPDFWDSLSANAYLADLSGPLQLHHGLADAEVPVQFSENLAAAVQSIGGTAELYTYPANDHNLSQSFTLAMQRTIAFYDKYLK